MTNSLYDIASSRFTLSTNHGSALVDAAKCLAQILSTADKRNTEISLIYMVYIISR